MMSTPEPKKAHKHEGGLSVRDQIERYRTAFISVIAMVVIAAAVGGYILAHENLKLPGWVPVLGRNFYTLKADFQTAQAVTPGQGQAVTIAGAKIGEVGSVDLHDGVATVTMKVTPKYARIYRNATALLRPKTQLQDITVEVDPGTPSAGKLPSGGTIPLAQTAPNVNFDEFLSSLDAETRAYLQELLAGAGGALKENGKALSATFKRFDPTARIIQEIASQLERRHANTARAIHNFRLLIEALGGKDKQLSELVDASNAVFATFAQEEKSVEQTVKLLPGALEKGRTGLGKLATAAHVLGPTLHELEPFAKALGPANEATRKQALATTPIIKNEVRPFAREILPTINLVAPDTKALAEAFPKLATSFGVLNELFNEIAYNPGKNQGGFLFFLDWANHNLNSVLSSGDAHGVLGRTLVYLNCEIAGLLKGVSEINPNVNLLVSLLNPPTKATCQAQGIAKGTVAAAHTLTRPKEPAAGLLSGFTPNAAAAPGGGR
ncbi:MAG TPA: MlaD family protein [Solirubrobacteraceae bacterium]|jgi:phospholipid/cholesterol/gamma-HCH transport system substrate-binding protein|nr:MlaD family protein [Solirubrobacteraceae bacterium]